MKQIKVNDDFNLYKRHTFIFEKGVTCLVGKNGSGKSNLLLCIKNQLEKEKIPCIYYDNYHEGGSKAHSRYSFYNQMDLLAASLCASEGQQIMLNYGQTLQRIGGFIRKNLREGQKEIFILLDALDSGLDISNIREVKSVFKLMLNEDAKADIYIIVAANTYEMVKGVPCIAVSTGKKVTFSDYEEFANFICSPANASKEAADGEDRE